ncbi:hypothetical protein CLAIMM_00046 [Cladophialophora immunda]|nr:hypothetical protein CLAIMM_00046 [Cladophialophora immunda]
MPMAETPLLVLPLSLSLSLSLWLLPSFSFLISLFYVDRRVAINLYELHTYEQRRPSIFTGETTLQGWSESEPLRLKENANGYY